LEIKKACPERTGELEIKNHGDDISLKRCRSYYGLLIQSFMLEKYEESGKYAMSALQCGYGQDR
jgi:hypothetical protein